MTGRDNNPEMPGFIGSLRPLSFPNSGKPSSPQIVPRNMLE